MQKMSRLGCARGASEMNEERARERERDERERDERERGGERCVSALECKKRDEREREREREGERERERERVRRKRREDNYSEGESVKGDEQVR